jgi:hypothetical protein
LVLALAIVMVLLFSLGSIFFGGGDAAPPPPPSAQPVPGTGLVAVPAAAALSPIVKAGQPPSDVLEAVVVPRGAVRTGHQNNTAAAGQYDQQVSFTVDAPEQAVDAFYRTMVRKEGWNVEAAGPTHGSPGLEVLGKRPASDGFYWELGALVAPTTFPPGPAGARGVTPLTLRLFQVPDEN